MRMCTFKKPTFVLFKRYTPAFELTEYYFTVIINDEMENNVVTVKSSTYTMFLANG